MIAIMGHSSKVSIKVLYYLQGEKIFAKTTTCIKLQAEQYTYFFNFGRGFSGSISMLLPKAPTSCGKNNLK